MIMCKPVVVFEVVVIGVVGAIVVAVVDTILIAVVAVAVNVVIVYEICKNWSKIID